MQYINMYTKILLCLCNEYCDNDQITKEYDKNIGVTSVDI